MITQNKLSMTTDIFSHLQPSLYADSIYYADLFRFKKTIWVIAGRGKSKAANLLIDNKEDDIGRDSVAIKLENNILYGYLGSWSNWISTTRIISIL
jgi:hypothetical protein